MTVFLRAVRGDEVIFALRRERDRNHRRRRRDKAVHHYGDMVRRRANHHARQPADFKAADFRQHIQPVFGVGLVHVERALNGGDFALESFVVHARAAPRDFFGRLAHQRAGDGGGRGGVADAHVACTDDVRPDGDDALHEFDAVLDGFFRLSAGHRFADGDVLRPRSDSALEQFFADGNFIGNAHVHHDDSRADVPRQRVDCRAAVEEVRHHLRRDLLRKGADSLGDDSVVACHGDDDFFFYHGNRLARNSRNLNRKFFQTSETASGLDERVLAFLRRLHGFLIERFDGADGGCD